MNEWMDPYEYYISQVRYRPVVLFTSMKTCFAFKFREGVLQILNVMDNDFYKLILLPGIPFDTCRSCQYCSLMKIEKECLAKEQVSAKSR